MISKIYGNPGLFHEAGSRKGKSREKLEDELYRMKNGNKGERYVAKTKNNTSKKKNTGLRVTDFLEIKIGYKTKVDTIFNWIRKDPQLLYDQRVRLEYSAYMALKKKLGK